MLSPLRERELNLHLAVPKVERERDERESFLLKLRTEPLDLQAVHEQPARARRLVILVARRIIGADVGVSEVKLVRLDGRVGVDQVRLRVAERLDLAAPQLDSRLEGLDHRVVVPRFSIRADDLSPVVALLGLRRRAPRHRVLPEIDSPVRAAYISVFRREFEAFGAEVAELVDALGSGSSVARRRGSTPLFRTTSTHAGPFPPLEKRAHRATNLHCNCRVGSAVCKESSGPPRPLPSDFSAPRRSFRTS